MSTCGCGKILRNNEPHDCSYSRTPTWSKVRCPACAGDGCADCNFEKRVWPERYEAIIEKYNDDERVRWCSYGCGRLAVTHDAYSDRVCAKCAQEAA